MGATIGGGRWPAVPRSVWDVLRTDLAPGRRDPLPRHRYLGRLPHGHLILLSVLMGLWEQGMYQRGVQELPGILSLLIVVQAAALVLALSRPVAAWWVSTAMLLSTGVAAAPVWGAPMPWSAPAIVLHGFVLLLLALRVRPTSASAALVLTLLVVVIGVGGPRPAVSHPPVLATGALVLTAAVVVGASLRAVRLSRTRLVEQEGLTAEERARRALLEERGRIARELHDVVAHHMSVISIQAQVAPHLVADPTPELRENLAGIRQNAVDALTELRRVLGVLRGDADPGDSAAGVRHAPQPTLERLGELLANVRAAGLDVTAGSRGEPRPLSPGTELSAYRIVQEALSNVMRHAPGARATVETHYHHAGLTLRITNTAPGRPAPTTARGGAREPGHGLLGMRERTAMLGGELVAGPTPDGGWDVTAVLPAPLPATPPRPEDGS
ncbi:sensor histidine kinase [Streptomyces sp. NPDC048717]|uniref:sensor histidine kinase n=1 Tax=Streptomyces sp. NPDC048717 TaxID=3154928 RepID=UPI00343B09AF